MSNFNMPPGVSTNQIPGNRPEDEAEEAFWLEVDQKFIGTKSARLISFHNTLLDDLSLSEAFEEYAMIVRDLAFDKGYLEGRSDEKYQQRVYRGEIPIDERR